MKTKPKIKKRLLQNKLKRKIRLAVKLKKGLHQIPICILADSLYPSQPFFDICKDNSCHFIITLKEGKLPTIWAEALSLLKMNKDSNRTEKLINANDSIVRYYSGVNKIDYHRHSLNSISK